MSEDFGVGDGAGDGRAVFVDQDGGRAHDVAAGSGGVSGNDGMAGGAGESFVLEGALDRHALREIAGEQGNRIVAALAMAGELDALLVDERVDVLEIPGRAEAVGVNRFPPLGVGGLVAVAAVLGGGEAGGREELAVVRHGIRRQEGRVFAEGVVVAVGDVVVERGEGAGDLDGGGVSGGVVGPVGVGVRGRRRSRR